MNFRCVAMEQIPYIKMIPLSGKRNEYTFTGMFADVWFDLQVRLLLVENGIVLKDEILNHFHNSRHN